MDWLTLALGLIKLANYVLGQWQTQRNFDAGRDAEIAKEAMATLQLTEAGKKIMAKLEAMSDKELDDITDALGK